MTFEIAFPFQEQQYKATVTTSGRDCLVNLSSPVQYEAYPTLVFTAHDDNSLGYDKSAVGEDDFMEHIAKALSTYITQHSVTFE